MRWLYAEYIEQPKLTKKERLFCELVETGWIAMDKNGTVYLHKIKPTKNDYYWDSDLYICDLYGLFDTQFKFITWQDTEPWAVEDLLKLEVEE